MWKLLSSSIALRSTCTHTSTSKSNKIWSGRARSKVSSLQMTHHAITPHFHQTLHTQKAHAQCALSLNYCILILLVHMQDDPTVVWYQSVWLEWFPLEYGMRWTWVRFQYECTENKAVLLQSFHLKTCGMNNPTLSRQASVQRVSSLMPVLNHGQCLKQQPLPKSLF